MNKIINFLKETWNRLFSGESPFYFRILQNIGLFITSISGLPAMINEFLSLYGSSLPEWVTLFANKTVFIIGAITFLYGRLTKKTVTIEKMPLTRPSDPDYDF